MNFWESHRGRARTCTSPLFLFYFIWRAGASQQIHTCTPKSETAGRRINGNAAAARARVKPRTLLSIVAVVWLPVGFSPPTLRSYPLCVLLHCLDPPHPNFQPDTTHHCVCVCLFQRTQTHLNYFNQLVHRIDLRCVHTGTIALVICVKRNDWLDSNRHKIIDEIVK